MKEGNGTWTVYIYRLGSRSENVDVVELDENHLLLVDDQRSIQNKYHDPEA